MSVCYCLLWLNVYIFKSHILQHTLNRLKSCTMKWCVYDLDVFCHLLNDFRMNGQITKLCKILLIHIIWNYFIQTSLDCFFFRHSLYHIKRSYLANLIHNTGVVWWCYLRTVLPVYLVSIILSRIVACCNYDTCNTAKFSYCKRKFRNRTKAFENISLDSICCKTQCCCIRKFICHQTGIMGNCNSLILSVLWQNIICKSLCCLAYCVYIHTIGSCSDHTTKSGSTKL